MLSYDGWVAISSNLANWWPAAQGPLGPFTWTRGPSIDEYIYRYSNTMALFVRALAQSQKLQMLPLAWYILSTERRKTACCKQADGIMMASASWRQTADESTSLWVSSMAGYAGVFEMQRKLYLGFMLFGNDRKAQTVHNLIYWTYGFWVAMLLFFIPLLGIFLLLIE